MTAPRRRGARGQATVELALVLPVVLVLVLSIVQLGLVLRDQIMVVNAAREGARAAIVEPSTAVAADAVFATTRLDPARTSVALSSAGSAPPLLTVTVTYRSTTEVPLIGAMLGDVTLIESTTMRRETP
jgi:Flp pilus assembly protein TadG